ncbi:MAG TPA: hypothetical protein PK511_06770, partial [Chitinophagales bacterium]|nr:hypothetical protein [Chitinophagales bacterium]HNA58400.1 hypothetical protein [Chitinophagales bacterium]HNF69642.1 hypothetical protein [Chitinophagales bacterium]HNI54205.1 hypothetical protein [Chitinophagales bacterium]HNJ90744.1 hypothetical protein [Chitinophagales bacterium]
MKRSLYIVMFLITGILFAGCPYSAEIALDERPNIPVDKAMLGKWELRSSSDYTYVITAKNDFVYSIMKKSTSDGSETVYEGFLSDINGKKFLNIYETGSTTPTYYFYLFTQTGNDRFKLDPVTDNIDETFTNSRDMRNYFAKNMDVSFFFDKDADEYLRSN